MGASTPRLFVCVSSPIVKSALLSARSNRFCRHKWGQAVSRLYAYDTGGGIMQSIILESSCKSATQLAHYVLKLSASWFALVQAASCIDASQGFQGSLLISDSIFSSNGPQLTSDMLGSPITVNCFGGMTAYLCNVTVSNTTFDQNHGRAGALHVSRAYSVVVEHVTCSNNLGGALLIEEVELVIIDNCQFTSNHDDGQIRQGIASAGGAACLLNCLSIKIFFSSFINCSSLGSGGAVFIDFGGQDEAFHKDITVPVLLVSDCHFHNCSSLLQNGGALCILAGPVDSRIISSNFTACSAAAFGGAVYAAASEALIIEDSSFIECVAGVLPDFGWPSLDSASIAVDTAGSQSGGGGLYTTTVQLVSTYVFAQLPLYS